MQGRRRRILELAGWDVSTGIPRDGDWVGIWGRSPTAWRGEAVAGWADAPVLTVEDAFLRSVLPGRLGNDGPLGLCIDRSGVHFDPTHPSDLESLLATNPLDDTALLDRARGAIERIRYWHLGKYAATDPGLAPPEPGYVVVVDQTRGDAALCGAGRDTFHEMLVVAAEEHPGNPILVKTHPETAGGARPGHFDGRLPVDRARIFDAPASPWRLFEGAVGVYTHSSTLGFEAIFAGHKPRVFGQPFYSGWGLTEDENPPPRRQRRLTRAQLFAAAMILYPKWYDAAADRLCEIEDAISQFAAAAVAWRQDRTGYVGLGIQAWKRPHMKRAFGQVRRMKFARSPASAARRAAREGRKVLVWGMAAAPEGAVRVEDGFLRSRGLGAELVPPLSLVLDDLGIYYDPSRPSRLDRLVAESGDLPVAEIRRSERLVAAIRARSLSKYNIDGPLPPIPENRPRILVVGQVEDDASILLGAGDIKTNHDLLKAARLARPDATILWKPHPDVEAGLRAGEVSDSDVGELADAVLHQADPIAAIEAVDEVWTMTSTLGLEALLRGKPVTCLGLPFYAGWGLTEDRLPRPPQRKHGITLAGLAHACLIGYPRYFDPATGVPLSPEQAVELLAAQRGSPIRTRPAGRLNRLLGAILRRRQSRRTHR